MTTETQTVETPVQTPTVQTVQRRAAVDRTSVWQAIVQGAKDGKTGAQVAEGLGMALLSFNQRLASIRKEFKDMVTAGQITGEFPKLKDGRTGSHGGGKGAGTRAMLMQAFGAVKTEAEQPAETQVELTEGNLPGDEVASQE